MDREILSEKTNNGKPHRDILIGCLCALGCETLYGMSFAFSKAATDVASPLELLGWRFFVAGAVMSLCVAAGAVRIRLRHKGLRPLLILSLFFPVIYFIGETFGISHTTVSESGVLIASVPAACMAVSTLILHRKPTRAQVIGMLVTFAGVLVTVFAVKTSSSLSVAGYLLLLVAVVSFAVYTALSERAEDYTGAEITWVMLLAGMTSFAALAFAEAAANGSVRRLISLPVREPVVLRAVIYQGIGCSILAFFMTNIALAKIGVNRTASFVGVATVVSVLTGSVVLHEPFTLLQGIGGIVILAGVYIANASLIRNKK